MTPDLAKVVAALEKAYGPPAPPVSDPWEAILRENVVYLADDEGREKAFRALKKKVGLRPADLLKAPMAKLVGISSLAGILPDNCANKIRDAAEIAEEEFGGDLSSVLDWPIPKAKKALRLFPGIGEPGAARLLLNAGRLPVLAVESNGLRVLVRLGFAPDGESYATTYRTATKNAHVDADCAWLAKAVQLLRKHGKETCKQNDPNCPECTLRKICPYAARLNPR